MRWAGILLMFACATAGAAQSPASPPAATQGKTAEQTKAPAEPPPKPIRPTAEEKWLYPAQRVSADVEQYASNLKRDLHAVAFTTLGSYWWKEDRPAAERWVYPAVDEITLVPQEESDNDRAIRLGAARRVLSIVTPLDPVLRERLKDVVTSAAPREGATGSPVGSQTADALVQSAMHAPPAELARAISESLQYGLTEWTVSGIIDLHAELPNDAQQLFERALSQAVNEPTEMPAFAAILALPADVDVPKSWRDTVTSAFARAFADGSLDQTGRCRVAGYLTNSRAFDSSVAQLAQAALSDCTTSGSDAAGDANIIRRDDPQTSDDYLKVASEAKLPSTRYHMKLTAGEKAEEEAKKEDSPGPEDGPVKALRILDGMMPDERAVSPSEYKWRREDVAVRASLWTLRFSGCSGALHVVDTSPRETILHVAVGVAEKLGGGSCFMELMQTTVMRQIDRIPAEDPNDYIRTMNLVLRHFALPQYPVQTILRAMDNWKERDPKTVARGEVVYSAAWNKLYPLAIVQELFNIPPDTLRAMARNYFRNELLRADFELLIVKGFLDRYEQDLQKEKAESRVAEK